MREARANHGNAIGVEHFVQVRVAPGIASVEALCRYFDNRRPAIVRATNRDRYGGRRSGEGVQGGRTRKIDMAGADNRCGFCGSEGKRGETENDSGGEDPTDSMVHEPPASQVWC